MCVQNKTKQTRHKCAKQNNQDSKCAKINKTVSVLSQDGKCAKQHKHDNKCAKGKKGSGVEMEMSWGWCL